MANGDIAAGEGMPVMTGGEDWRLGYDAINETRDLVALEKQARVSAVAGKAASTHTHTSAQISDATAGATADKICQRNSSGQIAVGTPTNAAHAVTKSYCDGNSDEANGPTDAAYARAATGSGWYAVYMNSSNQFMRNTSSARYKEDIQSLDPVDALAAVLALDPVTYHRKGQPAGTREIGLIAERCVDVPGLVTWDVPRTKSGKPREGGAPRPEAVRYEQVLPVYLLAAVKELAERVEFLEAALDRLTSEPTA